MTKTENTGEGTEHNDRVIGGVVQQVRCEAPLQADCLSSIKAEDQKRK